MENSTTQYKATVSISVLTEHLKAPAKVRCVVKLPIAGEMSCVESYGKDHASKTPEDARKAATSALMAKLTAEGFAIGK